MRNIYSNIIEMNRKSLIKIEKIFEDKKNVSFKNIDQNFACDALIISVGVLPNLDNEFSEYQFTVDNLEEFIGYRIKIVMSGTNEAKSPSFKDLRTIALA